MILKAVAIWAVIALAETLHGILRVRFLNRRLGDRRARQVAVFTGTLIILGISWLTVPWIAPADRSDCFKIGTLWIVLMLAFDIALGRFVFSAPWSRIAADFDPRKGGLLALGMLALFAAPWIAATIQGII